VRGTALANLIGAGGAIEVPFIVAGRGSEFQEAWLLSLIGSHSPRIRSLNNFTDICPDRLVSGNDSVAAHQRAMNSVSRLLRGGNNLAVPHCNGSRLRLGQPLGPIHD
jgi:hypothetical protein